uniref:Maternal effect embryo arrest 22 n=1 Tax=Leersia perrieri TaxID=77586 RepID=A0A0D9V670_9ORYZ
MAAEPSEPEASKEAAPAAAVSPGAAVGGPNRCCAKLWKKFQKSEESRAALRKGVKILNNEVDLLRKQHSELSKVCNEERLRGDSAEAARISESDARDMLEKEIIELKAQNSALQQSQDVCKNDNELLRVSELEEEIRRLKQVLGEERKKINSEKKNAEEEKGKILELQKLLKMETHKSEEYKRLSDAERKATNSLRASCEKLRTEASEAREKLAAQVKKTEEANKRAEEEKQKAAREKKFGDSEKSLAEKNKNLIEAERKRLREEKIRAERLFAKLEEQKKLNEDLRASIEVEKKNVMDQKNHINDLSQKLEEERKRSENLQRKFDDLCAVRDTTSFGKHGQQHIDVATDGANVRLLKEKLKLKKEQLKHVKNVSKLDKAKNTLIRRELQRLKQDWMQLLSRFNMLDDHLAADAVEGIQVLTELKRHPEMHNFEQNLLPHNPITAPYFGLQTGIVPFSSSVRRDYTSYQLPRESCTRPISGTSSELEPPVGSSLRTKSKSPHRSSCPTSISDKNFMGSQGKDKQLVSASTDIRRKQSTMVPKLTTKDGNGARKHGDKALPAVSCDSFQHKVLKSSMPDATEVTDKLLKEDKKRKRTKSSLKSTDCLSSKHKQLHLEMKAHDATANGISCSDDRSRVQQGNSIMPVVNDDDTQIHRRKCHIADKNPSFSIPAIVPFPEAGNPYAVSKFPSLFSFEEMIKGDCLKLLNLDNDEDEERYRKAMERSLSPDLPILLPHTTKAPIDNKSHRLSDRTPNAFEYERDCPASRANSTDLERGSSLLGVEGPAIQKLIQNTSKLGHNRKDNHDNVKQPCVNDKSNSVVNISCNTKLDDVRTKCSLSSILHEDRAQNVVASPSDEARNTSSSHPNSTSHLQHSCKETSNENGTSQIYSSYILDSKQQNVVGGCKTKAAGSTDLNSNSICGPHHGDNKSPMYFVSLVSMKESNIIRIFRYWETLVAEAREISEEFFVDTPLFERVSAEPLLLLEEKVALIVSLLLWDICSLITADPIVDGNFASSVFPLTVKSYMETRWVFLKSNKLNVSVSLIEDLLMKREVVVCNKMGHAISDVNKHGPLDDDTSIQVSVKPATIDQFISACALLALICVKVERMDIVLEVSYKVLLMGKSNLSWTLLAIHVIGSMCGDKFLFSKSCNFLMTTIQLIVLLLETNDNSLCLVSSYVQSNRPTVFPTCAHCLFDVDTISIDGFISSLLDELNLCSQQWNNHSNSNKIIARCNPQLETSGLEVNCGELCYISKQAKLSEDIYAAGRDLCYFAEIISLLELFGNYMSCEWTYNNVVVRLLKILESCICDEYSAALLILLSQLGRFFVDDVGYEQRTVSDLRNKLSELMRTKISSSRTMPVQLSAVGALLSLLPLTFDKIVSHTGELPDRYVLQAKQISEWFCQLSKEHQSLAFSFFS